MIETEKESTAMSTAEIDRMHAVEDSLWWYRAQRAHVVRAINPPRPDFQLLDAGCGTGGMLEHVRATFPDAELTGIDFSERALELTALRNVGAMLMHGSTDQLPFDDASFDVVLSLDVLVLRGLDDRAAARELHRVLRPGGTVIVNVAALDFLRGSHDRATNMSRRYTRARLRRLLEGAGFAMRTITYWNMTLMPAVAVVRWASRMRAKHPDVVSDLTPVWPPFNAVLHTIARTELAASRRVPLPFGTSLFAVAQK